MKKSNRLLWVFGVLLIVFLVSLGYNLMKEKNTTEYVIDQSDFIEGSELVDDIDPSALSDEETAGLILMREEEKLARDVYKKLYEKWGINIFNNIADSEQTHTDTVKVLLDRYEIDDPVKDDTIGSFTSEELGKIYTDLLAKGETSRSEALVVGATVEDLDINDLNKLLNQTDNQDIISTYNNLNKGSRNHLRAFIGQIESGGDSYTPVYISQTEFDEIMSAGQESGRVR